MDVTYSTLINTAMDTMDTVMNVVDKTRFTILFHGNCIDGWFSAFVTSGEFFNNSIFAFAAAS